MLSATNQLAILATADGTKTVTQLISEALTNFRAMTIPTGYGWVIRQIDVPFSETERYTLYTLQAMRTSITSTSALYASNTQLSSTGIIALAISFPSGHFRAASIINGNVSNMTYDSIIPNSGLTIAIRYEVYKKL